MLSGWQSGSLYIHSIRAPPISVHVVQVYVLGMQTVVTYRPSLGDSYLQSEKAVQKLPRISCVSAAGGQQPGVSSAAGPSSSHQWTPPDEVRLRGPPEWVTKALAYTLRKRLGMQLFNFDLICPDDEHGLYYVVDINYFPGVDKIPDFEQRFVDFLRAVCEDNEPPASPEALTADDAIGADTVIQNQPEVVTSLPSPRPSEPQHDADTSAAGCTQGHTQEAAAVQLGYQPLLSEMPAAGVSSSCSTGCSPQQQQPSQLSRPPAPTPPTSSLGASCSGRHGAVAGLPHAAEGGRSNNSQGRRQGSTGHGSTSPSSHSPSRSGCLVQREALTVYE